MPLDEKVELSEEQREQIIKLGQDSLKILNERINALGEFDKVLVVDKVPRPNEVSGAEKVPRPNEVSGVEKISGKDIIDITDALVAINAASQLDPTIFAGSDFYDAKNITEKWKKSLNGIYDGDYLKTFVKALDGAVGNLDKLSQCTADTSTETVIKKLNNSIYKTESIAFAKNTGICMKVGVAFCNGVKAFGRACMDTLDISAGLMPTAGLYGGIVGSITGGIAGGITYGPVGGILGGINGFLIGYAAGGAAGLGLGVAGGILYHTYCGIRHIGQEAGELILPNKERERVNNGLKEIDKKIKVMKQREKEMKKNENVLSAEDAQKLQEDKLNCKEEKAKLEAQKIGEKLKHSQKRRSKRKTEEKVSEAVLKMGKAHNVDLFSTVYRLNLI